MQMWVVLHSLDLAQLSLPSSAPGTACATIWKRSSKVHQRSVSKLLHGLRRPAAKLSAKGNALCRHPLETMDSKWHELVCCHSQVIWHQLPVARAISRAEWHMLCVGAHQGQEVCIGRHGDARGDHALLDRAGARGGAGCCVGPWNHVVEHLQPSRDSYRQREVLRGAHFAGGHVCCILHHGCTQREIWYGNLL